jgi:hypothetical protein
MDVRNRRQSDLPATKRLVGLGGNYCLAELPRHGEYGRSSAGINDGANFVAGSADNLVPHHRSIQVRPMGRSPARIRSIHDRHHAMHHFELHHLDLRS